MYTTRSGLLCKTDLHDSYTYKHHSNTDQIQTSLQIHIAPHHLEGTMRSWAEISNLDASLLFHREFGDIDGSKWSSNLIRISLFKEDIGMGRPTLGRLNRFVKILTSLTVLPLRYTS